MAIFNNILETIGHTPLVKLNNITKNIPSSIYVKAECLNPGGSGEIGARPPLSIIPVQSGSPSWTGCIAPSHIKWRFAASSRWLLVSLFIFVVNNDPVVLCGLEALCWMLVFSYAMKWINQAPI